MLKSILFDLDGTLVDSLRVTFDGFNHAFRVHGQPELTPAQIMAHFGPGEKEIFRAIVGDELHEKASAEYHRYVRERMQDAPLFSGVREVLEEFHSQGIPMSVVTGRGRKSTDYLLEHHGLAKYFVTTVTHDDVSSSKPSPEGILKALGVMNCDAAHAAYVGDMWVDVRASNRAGCVSVSAMWDSAYDLKLVDPEAPHVYVEKPPGLTEFMRSGLRDPDLRTKRGRF